MVVVVVDDNFLVPFQVRQVALRFALGGSRERPALNPTEALATRAAGVHTSATVRLGLCRRYPASPRRVAL